MRGLFGRVANEIVSAIVRDLSGRKGLGDEWDTIDEDIKEEIIANWEDIVIRAVGKLLAQGRR